MKDKISVKQSDWYIGKYGIQSEVSATASERGPVFSRSLSQQVDGTQSTDSVDSSFFKSKLEAKGVTFSTPVEEITPRVREARVKPEGKGFTASFADVVKMKLAESKTATETPTTSNTLPFQQKFINKVSGTSTPFASKARKFFVAVPTETTKLDLTDFEDFVAATGKITKIVATSMIKLKKVTVNDLVVTDVNYTLKSGDTVRVGLTGHFTNNTEGIAIVN